MSEPDYQMLYLGTAQLLVQTHNRYVNTLHGNISEDHVEAIEAFIEDFNALGLHHVISPAFNGWGRIGIFDRDQLSTKEVHGS